MRFESTNRYVNAKQRSSDGVKVLALPTVPAIVVIGYASSLALFDSLMGSLTPLTFWKYNIELSTRCTNLAMMVLISYHTLRKAVIRIMTWIENKICVTIV